MENHECANLFPMLADVDLKSLSEDIKANGLQTPITLLEGKILDGRNRNRACELAGVAPRFENYAGTDPLGFVVSHNLHRRHLSESQRGMVAAKLANLRSGNPSFTITSMDAIAKPVAVHQQEAADALNIGKATLQRAKKVQRDGSPELNAAVEAGEVSVRSACKVAELSHEEQAEVLAQGMDAVRAKAVAMREESAPAPEPEPVVVDGTKSDRIPKFVSDDADRLWLLGKIQLDKILSQDVSRERVLNEVIAYAQNRISTKK